MPLLPRPLTRRQFSVATGAALVGASRISLAQGEDKIIVGQSAPFTGPAA